MPDYCSDAPSVDLFTARSRSISNGCFEFELLQPSSAACDEG
jgi:hypothetical protein